MSLAAIDTTESTVNHVHALVAEGIQAVLLYARSDRTGTQQIAGLRSMGVQIGWIWEKGNPTSANYFSQSQGVVDATRFLSEAAGLGIPMDSTVFACVDYDATQDDIDGPITDYMTAFHQQVKDGGYMVGVYGSGLTCECMIAKGIAHYGYLDQSTGHQGHTSYLSRADIIQGPSGTVCGLACDHDVVVNADVVS